MPFAVLIAYIAGKISNKQPDRRMTFGFKRVEILAALLNAVILIVVTIYLFYEAYMRFFEPAPVKGAVMFAVACIGLVANLAAVFLLRKNSGRNINIRAAYIHHIHIWNLTDRQIHFEGHADLKENLTAEKTGAVLKQIENVLLENFGISHTTVQFEYHVCEDTTVIHRGKERGERREERGEIKE